MRGAGCTFAWRKYMDVAGRWCVAGAYALPDSNHQRLSNTVASSGTIYKCRFKAEALGNIQNIEIDHTTPTTTPSFEAQHPAWMQANVAATPNMDIQIP